MKERQSNIEVLRIVCMIAIVLSHFFGQSNFRGDRNLILLLFSSGSRIATNIYIIISCWFFQESRVTNRYNKIFGIWFTMLFYNLLGTAIVFFCGNCLSITELISAVLPFSRKNPWFGSAYICLLLFHPFLQKAVEIPQKQLARLCIVLFICIPLLSMFSKRMDTFLDQLCWFVSCYFFVGYYKRYLVDRLHVLPVFSALFGILVYFCLVFLKGYGQGHFRTLAASYLLDMKTLPNFLCSICLFHSFIKINSQSNKIINRISMLTFPLYCFHQAANFYPFIWNDVFLANKWENKMVYAYAIGMVTVMFVFVGIIEPIRRYLMEHLMKSRIIEKMNNKINTLLSD